MRKFLCLFLTAVMLTAFASCGSDDAESNPLVGTWEFEYHTYTYTDEEEIEVAKTGYCVFTKDGLFMFSDGEHYEGSIYKCENDVLKLQSFDLHTMRDNVDNENKIIINSMDDLKKYSDEEGYYYYDGKNFAFNMDHETWDCKKISNDPSVFTQKMQEKYKSLKNLINKGE